MSIPLTPTHLTYAVAHPLRIAVIALLSDPAGPLGDCAARPEDAPAAYMLARIYRHARAQGHLHGKPGFEAEALFATRVRFAVRSSTDPFAFTEKLARAARSPLGRARQGRPPVVARGVAAPDREP